MLSKATAAPSLDSSALIDVEPLPAVPLGSVAAFNSVPAKKLRTRRICAPVAALPPGSM